MKGAHNEAEAYRFVLSGELRIDSDGKIWRDALRRGRSPLCATPIAPIRAERIIWTGYFQLRVRCGGGRRLHVYSHRLVWFSFHGAIPDDMEINHRNGIKSDNHPDNLEAVTRLENIIHSRDVIRTFPTGERSVKAKLTVAAVREIRTRSAAGDRTVDLAQEFAVGEATVRALLKRLSWASVE